MESDKSDLSRGFFVALLLLVQQETFAGTLYFKDSVYEGEVVNGRPHGLGRWEWVDGSIYEGELFLGIRKGQGTYIYKNGDFYEGNWLNDKRDGSGTFVYHDGWIWSGIWSNDDPLHGSLTGPDGLQVIGLWIEDGRGSGVIVYPDGSKYVGKFQKSRVRTGEGKMFFPDGSSQEGRWLNDKRNGLLTLSKPDGTTLRQTFSNDKLIKESQVFAAPEDGGPRVGDTTDNRSYHGHDMGGDEVFAFGANSEKNFLQQLQQADGIETSRWH